MKWIYYIKPKYKTAFILALVFVLVLGNNILSKKNVTDLGTSFSEVYEDRLLVESYIFKLSDLLYRKKIMLDKLETANNLANRQQNLQDYTWEINILLADYEKTKLTQPEIVAFRKLKQSIAKMQKLENNLTSDIETGKVKNLLETEFNAAAENLSKLSAIQVSEGKILNDESKRNIAGFTLLTQFEMATLILLGLLIQGLVFASGSIMPKSPQKHSLN